MQGDSELIADLAIILGLVLLNGVFAGTEIAVLALRRTRIHELAELDKARGAALRALRENPERFLATVQIGITIASGAAAALAGKDLSAPLARQIGKLGWLAPWADDIAFVGVVAGVGFLSLVLGELVPKSLALRAAEAYALRMARPLVWLCRAIGPVAWVLTRASNLVLRPLGDSTTFLESKLSGDEIRQLLDEAVRQGTVDAHSGPIALRAMDFGVLTAGAVMVPRNRMVALDLAADPDTVVRTLLDAHHERVPIFDGAPDHLVGYVLTFEVLRARVEGRPTDLKRLMRRPIFVPWTMKAGDVLREMQARAVQMAIVVDEHGGVDGLITAEDLMAELVGPIGSELQAPRPGIVLDATGGVVVDGATPIRDVNRDLDLGLPITDDVTTLGGLVSLVYGGIPAPGVQIFYDEGAVVFEVTASGARTVDAVRVEPRAGGALGKGGAPAVADEARGAAGSGEP
ncbi:MAG: HlyC/CorC family transporter [Myxococcales bacterium]|nr:HlyC/CorC family transporter [Myxococcales bacterium]